MRQPLQRKRSQVGPAPEPMHRRVYICLSIPAAMQRSDIKLRKSAKPRMARLIVKDHLHLGHRQPRISPHPRLNLMAHFNNPHALSFAFTASENISRFVPVGSRSFQPPKATPPQIAYSRTAAASPFQFFGNRIRLILLTPRVCPGGETKSFAPSAAGETRNYETRVRQLTRLGSTGWRKLAQHNPSPCPRCPRHVRRYSQLRRRRQHRKRDRFLPVRRDSYVVDRVHI